VPDIHVEALDPDFGEGRSVSEWARVWSFALSYDGYAYFGGDSDAGGRLTAFARSVREAYDRDGRLPKLDLRLLRATLFIEQRLWCKSNRPTVDERSARYLSILLREIRSHL
jgi:hypothetical protein